MTIILAAHVSDGDRLVGAIFLVLAACSSLLGPIAWYWLRPEPARKGLARLKDWFVAHQKLLNEAVCVVFGLIFTIHGLQGL
jgi:hypothetical protein